MTEVLEANFLISCFPVLKFSLRFLKRIHGKEKKIITNALKMADIIK